MAQLIKYKVKGMAILEPVVAIVIISGVVAIASLIFGNVAKKNNNYLLFKAQNEIEALMRDVDLEEDESFGYDAFEIDKEIETYGRAGDILQVTWAVRNKLSDETIYQQKQLIHKWSWARK